VSTKWGTLQGREGGFSHILLVEVLATIGEFGIFLSLRQNVESDGSLAQSPRLCLQSRYKQG